MKLCVSVFAVVCLAALTQCANVPLSAPVQQAIVKQLNDMRAKVAGGQEGSQPKATNMQKLEWYGGAASFARDHAVTEYSTGCEPKSASAEWVLGGKKTGAKFGSDAEIQAVVKDIIDEWYNQVRKPAADKDYRKDKSDSGEYKLAVVKPENNFDGRQDYRQIVWALSSKVGCGLNKCKSGTDAILYCKFFEPTKLGMKPYEEGNPCSNCPNGGKCASDGKLCQGACQDLWSVMCTRKDFKPEECKEQWIKDYCPKRCGVCK